MNTTCKNHSLGATLSNFFGQLVVEKYGHIVSLTGSLLISFVPILLFCFMPETLGDREHRISKTCSISDSYIAHNSAVSYKPMPDVI